MDLQHTHALARRFYRRLCHQQRLAPPTSYWWALRFSFTYLQTQLQHFIDGDYVFQPLQQYRFREETIRIWSYLDRIILRLLLKIIKPTFKYLISILCFHLAGPAGVKAAIRHIEKAHRSGQFTYALRLDIKSYYASISHKILIQQVKQAFQDPRVQHYLEAIISIAVDDGGHVFRPSQGIPRRSSLSPFFGALYLSPLDKAFEHQKGIAYARYMDDIVILCQTKRQYQRARKILFAILRPLKLSLSPRKSWMGKLSHGFHFLGVSFQVTKPDTKIQSSTIITIHPRSCARALDKVKALFFDAVHPATTQRYLSQWAHWWAFAVKPLFIVDLLEAWVSYTQQTAPNFSWLGAGLLV